ncbi:MAG: hypothetical protein QF903_04345 [Planctomycetota bacterium]|jgi:hypothetical protein|nr:hypothetical protein [Planctomycetota bacterium]MDP6988687.1 hypothetical protein [Planctomycetota bacterium]
MDLRNWLYVGLCLLDIYNLVEVLVGVPSVMVSLSMNAPSSAMMSLLGTMALRLNVGLFLVVKAPSIAGALAERSD